MAVKKNPRRIILAIVVIPLVCAACSMGYTLVQLNLARGRGLYPSPEEAISIRAHQYYSGVSRVLIERAGPNAFDGSSPHVWYVVWSVYADSRADGSDLYHGAYESGGSYYLHLKDGWVQMPEGYFPEYIGFWMKVLRIAG